MGDDATNQLPPGFRFFPTDEELVVHFLYRKAALLPCHPNIIPSLDLRRYDPWELNGKALGVGNQWYFFSRIRTQNWVSATGYWKATGGDGEPVVSDNRNVGMKKRLVFHIGEAPDGIKTNWVMQEYHLSDCGGSSTSSAGSNSGRRSSKKRAQPKVDSNIWVLCRVYEADGESQTGFHGDGSTELSCLDEVFLSLDDLDEISLPNLDQ